MSITEAHRTTDFTLPHWSAAEYLDMPFVDGTILRALICRLGAGKWQWTILSIDGENGDVIGIGATKTVAEARLTAASELDKCTRDPFA